MIDFSKIKIRRPKDLRFSSAGIPLSTPVRNTGEGVKHVRSLGLGGMELEFVHSVNLNQEAALSVGKIADEHDVVLSAHGSYYINLNALEPQKVGASKSRILEAAKIARLAGAFSVTFHPAFYLKDSKEIVYNNVRTQLQKIVQELKDKGNDITISPETTGKGTQFGDLKELVSLSAEVDQVRPCIDFAHLHARSVGKYNSLEEFRSVLSIVEDGLGREALDNMHMHVAGIAYGDKGEKHHLILEDSDLKYDALLRALKEFKVKGSLVCESPNIEGDALLLKKTYESIK
ncbi:TIM barrel protein [Candidatus Woesearchaeota archaeon]|jgi:deoxyribonuclease-4|nr:TIM barrel protein [Candidatus Woesearchaeota archaeon]